MADQAPLALDFDGTIVDCRRRQVAVATAIVERIGGAPLDGVVFWRRKRQGRSTMESLLALGYPQGLAAAANLAWRREIENEDNLLLDRILPGAADILRRVQAGGTRIVLLTARSRPDAFWRQISRLGLTPFLDAAEVVLPATAGVQKRAALARMDAQAFVGDTETDFHAAQGLPFAAVSTGQRSPSYLRRCGVAPITADLGQALSMLGFLSN